MLGHNGSGKSTVLKNIYRALRPDGGSITLDGEDLLKMSHRESALKLAVVGQENELPFDFTVEEIVAMGRSPHKKLFDTDTAQDKAIVHHALEHLGMADMAKRSYLNLSGGEKQRTIIARAVAQESDFLILDEPTNHLDMRSKDVLKDALREFDGTVILVSHDREFLDGLVDKVYEFGNQKVVEHLGGIYNFLEHKKMDSLRELERSTGTSTSTSGTGEAQVSQNKLSYEARKELSKAIKKAEKVVAEAEARISELENGIAVIEAKLATPEGASDASLYGEYSALKKELSDAMDLWTERTMELEELNTQDS